jgi:hypothetical protein
MCPGEPPRSQIAAQFRYRMSLPDLNQNSRQTGFIPQWLTRRLEIMAHELGLPPIRGAGF